MNIKNVFISFIVLSFIFPVYNVGDIVSNSDQNVTLSVCDQTSEYSVGDEVSLAGWNGDLNGGDYHVIWLEMSASW
tara:strand:+ start:941 stop:1168 length:228 start_codon:yes stop_codon:yes gene_type:complete